MEIYNEIIKDLLKPGNDNLKIHQNLNVSSVLHREKPLLGI